MVNAPLSGRFETSGTGVAGRTMESSASAISWAAIIAGAFATDASTLILLALGSGFGLASISPWPNSGASLTTFTLMTAIWLIIVQWVSSGLGGYLTGRLRTKWVGVHTHEVFFRDTAHGFLAWAVAAVLGAAVLASAVSSMLSGAAHVTGTIASGAAASAGKGAVQDNPYASYVDRLFRSKPPDAKASDEDVRAETTRILAEGIEKGELPAGDKTYLGQLVAVRTGLSKSDAEQRVDDVIATATAARTRARQIADGTRRAGIYLSIFTGVSMLIGAFIAAAAAALGGRHRDEDWRAHAGPFADA
jgi:hypothetical protein